MRSGQVNKNKTVSQLRDEQKRKQKLKNIVLSPLKLDWYQLIIITLLILILNK